MAMAKVSFNQKLLFYPDYGSIERNLIAPRPGLVENGNIFLSQPIVDLKRGPQHRRTQTQRARAGRIRQIRRSHEAGSRLPGSLDAHAGTSIVLEKQLRFWHKRSILSYV